MGFSSISFIGKYANTSADISLGSHPTAGTSATAGSLVTRKGKGTKLAALVLFPVVISFAACIGLANADSPVAPGDVKVENLAINDSLSGAPGDPAEGKKTFANRKLGNCLACHANSDMSDQLFHGEVGPSLDGVGARWSEAQLRTIVANAKIVFTSETVMPGFYSLDVGEDVREDLIGKTILSAQQVEDVIAYLATLK